MAPTKARKPAHAASSTSSKSTSAASESSASNALQQLAAAYLDSTPAQLKLIDAFMAFFVVSGVSLFAYCLLISNFPFNAFLASFASCVGQFVLLASLRIQSDEGNSELFNNRSKERAFADFLVGSVVLHFFVFNFRKPSWPYYAPDAALWDNPDTADFLYAQWGNL